MTGKKSFWLCRHLLVKPLQKKHDTGNKTKTFSSVPQHLLYLRENINLTKVLQPRLTLNLSSSSPMSLLLLVPRRGPDWLTGTSVFQWHGNRCWRRRSGREGVQLSISARLEGPGRRKLQGTKRKNGQVIRKIRDCWIERNVSPGLFKKF